MERFKRFMSLKKNILQKGLVNLQSTDEYSKNIYALPVPKENIKGIDVKNSPAHVGNLNNSIDFTLPEGTEVFAAADGLVVDVKADSKVGAEEIKYWNEGNYVEIKHGEEYSYYEHFKFNGVLVKQGDKVKQGQIIGYSGNTGFSSGPHLHFEVKKYFDRGEEDYVTLRVRFKDFPDVYS